MIGLSKVLRWFSYGAVGLAGVAVGSLGLWRGHPQSPSVERNAVKLETVERGPMIRKIQGAGVLIPENTRWLAAVTDGHVDRVLARPGERVRPETLILRLSNPDLDRQLVDSEWATKKTEAELANLRVQLQSQLLNERAIAAQLESDAAEARLQADRDEALLKLQVGAALNAKISRSRANSLRTRLEIENEKLAISEEARQAQLAAKQAEVAQIQALYALKMQQKESLLVRAGIYGVLEEVSVDAGQQVGPGTNLARVTDSARLIARIHVPEAEAQYVQLNQKAHVAISDQTVSGHVARIDPAVQNGTVNVDVSMDGRQPHGSRSELAVDGTIEVEKLQNVLHLSSPLQGRPDTQVPLFRVSADGTNAERVMVQYGRISSDGVEIADGLEAGDTVIVSDMSAWGKYDHVQLK
ncbi:MAG: HlyD family efflux transporter periplasmic adaptor subunit [Candidatus Acidiferrum sp.]